MDELVLGLQVMVARELNKAGSPYKLAEQIKSINEQQHTGCYVDRRTLEKLVKNPEKVNISLRMLKALEAYFASKGMSLKGVPIFIKPYLIDSLVEQKRITFFLGSKPRPGTHRNDISRWDTRSLARLISRVSGFEVHMDYDIEDVLLETPMDEKAAARTDWYKMLDDSTRSLVAIGSPKACHASEVMLARMLGVEPFESALGCNGSKLRVPFAFVWHRMPPGRFRSSFCLTHREVKRIGSGIEIADVDGRKHMAEKKTSALILDIDRCRAELVPAGRTEWDAYGMIVAQRRAGGSVWVVLAGITGPATYAAAELLKGIRGELPRQEPNGGMVLIQPIAVTIKIDRDCKVGDNREIKNPRLIGEALLWKATSEKESLWEKSAQ
ncbi:MAG: hypothetical protein QHJ82_06575 [Verrucomicrobiota bacterium]|nr:hypothetical protein [Verrucomicrobiota bacterium]